MDKASMSDSDLLHLVRSGDPSGLAFVYERFRKEYIGWIRKFSRCDEDDACEYFQASILILYENIMTAKLTDLQSSLKTYLFGIGKNLVKHDYRKSRQAERVKAEYLLQHHLASDAKEILQEETDLGLIGRCFARIGDPCHKLLELFYFQQQSMEEISSQLGYKNPDTAKNQKYKCMERLRKLVEDERATSLSVTDEL